MFSGESAGQSKQCHDQRLIIMMAARDIDFNACHVHGPWCWQQSCGAWRCLVVAVTRLPIVQHPETVCWRLAQKADSSP